ncbi:hypothetical protein F511_08637 [Dorcoceras hygrometricum]|uniref:Uncharacterized protein n=1 Tax=Dorcoceras hygrometricum TaxID=472368 RepID=A0A2Z7AW27_9LAMI|nr:hypothetical protein F511_08637 [Dorcoceras hygrometricum]
MHEGTKEQSVIKANNSAGKSEELQNHAQPINRWKSSIRDLQERHTVDHHSSVVFRCNNSAGHHLDDSIGPFRSDKSVSRSQRLMVPGNRITKQIGVQKGGGVE